MIVKTLEFLHATWFTFVFVLTFLLLYPLFLIFLSTSKFYPIANKLRKFWARWIMLFTGIRMQKIYEDRDTILKEPCIYVANHTSYLDILSMALIAKGNFMFMAKKELAKIPLFGIFFRTVDLAVNRSNSTEAAKAFKRTLQRMEQRVSVIIFPEGTIGTQVPNLRIFKSGAFKLAIESKKSIVPVTLLSNWKLLPDRKGWKARPGLMKVFIHRPISTSNLNKTHEEELKQKVYSIIETKLKQERII
jgi:1-acyl-sn-glycerol-3-phosphate acyltransferase